MNGLIALVVGISIFFVLGVVATFWTERLRSYYIRQGDLHPDSLRWLRLYGLLCLGTALFLIWVFARQWFYR